MTLHDLIARIDDSGRCCGRKPLVYKSRKMLFCCRCDRSYDMTTKEQIANWAWHEDAGKFVKTTLGHHAARASEGGR